jgi:poly-gamma-glutamate capsule biosynthesis protein CapA/YwtB (metallophosphatase superfamily)
VVVADKPGAAPRLVLAGDVAAESADPEALMGRVAPYLRDSAIAFCNCEWPLTDRGAPWPGKAGRLVRARPDLVRLYTLCGFDVVSLANNHVMNYGAEGLLQTIEVLERSGIRHCGAGADLHAAHRPATVERGGRRYAFLAYTSVFTPGFEATSEGPGMAVVRIDARYRIPKRLHEMPGSPLDVETKPDPEHLARARRDIAQARAEADAVIVSWHWGVSMGYQHLVPYQSELAHAAIDAGADLVVGHHPHLVQPIEIYKGKVIAYCLGHCGFDMVSERISDESILLEVALADQGLGEATVRPLANAKHGPQIPEPATARLTLDFLARLSAPLGTAFERRGEAAIPHPAHPQSVQRATAES